MVQMVGVIILALGLEQMFASIDHGSTLDNGVMVAGYVVMRTSMLFLWSEATRHDPARASATRTYLWTIALAQAGWVTLVLLELSVVATFALAAVLLTVELAGPAIAERRYGGTPWHADHLAERYGLLVIVRRPRRDGRWPARRGIVPRARDGDRRGRDGAQCGNPTDPRPRGSSAPSR
jgi:low temperature requirement protein LtrA